MSIDLLDFEQTEAAEVKAWIALAKAISCLSEGIESLEKPNKHQECNASDTQNGMRTKS